MRATIVKPEFVRGMRYEKMIRAISYMSTCCEIPRAVNYADLDIVTAGAGRLSSGRFDRSLLTMLRLGKRLLHQFQKRAWTDLQTRWVKFALRLILQFGTSEKQFIVLLSASGLIERTSEVEIGFVVHDASFNLVDG